MKKFYLQALIVAVSLVITLPSFAGGMRGMGGMGMGMMNMGATTLGGMGRGAGNVVATNGTMNRMSMMNMSGANMMGQMAGSVNANRNINTPAVMPSGVNRGFGMMRMGR